MKKQALTIAMAAAIGLSAIAPATAALRLPATSVDNAAVVKVGSHSYGHKRHYHKPRPKRHYHYHCHRRLVYGYWKKTCHKAWHNPWGRHHGHGYH